MLEELFACLNTPHCTPEERQNAQSKLLAIQRDSTSWPQIPQWLNNSNEQIQFFGAQCLLVRINRDWDELGEENQIALRDEIARFLAQPTLTASTRSKLEEALVKVMERAAAWWKDPIGELLVSPAVENLRLLSLVAALASSVNDASAYRWHHQLKEAAPRLLHYLQAFSEISSLWLDCLRNWTAFGAFSFSALLPVLPLIFAASASADVVDLLVEICELPTRDEAEESKKLDLFLPFLEQATRTMEEEEIARIASALTEATSTVLVSRSTQPAIQNFFRLLLQLSRAEGVAGVEEESSALLLTAWYLICEAAGEVDISSQQEILLSILSALAPILLEKAKIPEAQVWSTLPRDQQQQFMQLRREYLDTFLYLQRVFQGFGSAALLQLIFEDLQAATSTASIEVRLCALIVIAEEAEEWSPQWSSILSLLFSASSSLVNAKLSISLVGNLLPCMDAAEASQAVQMLLNQLENPEITEECLTALQRAADCEIPCLLQPEIISQLAQKVTPSSPEAFIRFLTRLLSDLREEERFAVFCQSLLFAVPLTSTQLTCAFKAFKMPKQDFLDLTALQQVNELVLRHSQSDFECLIAALDAFAQAGPVAFEVIVAGGKGRSEAQQILLNWISAPTPIAAANRILGAITVAWRAEAVEFARFASQRFLCQRFDDLSEQDEAGELLMEAWMRTSCAKEALLPLLFNYALPRLVSGAVSIPTLRVITKFVCFLLEQGVFDVAAGECDLLCTSILSAGASGKLGRSGMEIAARILFDVSGQNPTHFSKLLVQCFGSEERVFLRSIGGAHTLKKFKTVLVEFCVKLRTGE